MNFTTLWRLMRMPITSPSLYGSMESPGCSSIGGGVFTELGPFFPTGDGQGLRINSKSWNKGKQQLDKRLAVAYATGQVATTTRHGSSDSASGEKGGDGERWY
ncbi:hypothetical protein CASFOL_005939 [Castilleja foliolosa]|uniref:Uncharacterized protein n=1 Tax=Castilleja foliolosa TaxID=1961234 RepID=A0ABD3E4X9_9LAMI